MKLEDISAGDTVSGFMSWGCVPADAVRTVQNGASGLYVQCSHGMHLLDGQVGNDGHLIGIISKQKGREVNHG